MAGQRPRSHSTMPPSFRDRFRRRSDQSSTSAPTNTSGGGGGGISYPGKSFLGRSSSNSNSNNSFSSRRSNSSSHHNQRQQKRNSSQGGQHHHHPPLATFDACIEACDALAASSSQRQSQVRQISEGDNADTSSTLATAGEGVNNSEDQDDAKVLPTFTFEHGSISDSGDVHEIIPDCSVLVSPDGALLFTSQSTLAHSSSSNETSADDTNKIQNDKSNNKDSGEQDRYPWTKISTEDRDGVILEEEYESAVICGNDLAPLGDYDSNGFSARGWNPDAATLALSASRDVLRCMEAFVEELATCKKEEAACVSEAVDKLSMGFRDVSKVQKGWGRNGRNHKQIPMSDKRMGPILSSGTKLAEAMEAMEEYYTQSSESSLERWRMACSERRTSHAQLEPNNELKEIISGNKEDDATDGIATKKSTSIDPELINGMLPKLRSATIKATSRTSEREHALSDIRAKVTESQTMLHKQKDWAASQWRRVSDEESNIDRLYAIKKMEQHEYYEEMRQKQEMAMLEQHSNMMSGHIGIAGGGGMEATEEAPLSEDIWEMVQGVATSMEDFTHTGYSPRTLRKANVQDVMSQRFDASGHAIDPESSHKQPIPPLPIPDMPKLITRADVERESEISDLKMVAAAADESVEDAAGKLLNVMSKSDTTLRSARLASESCLLSECNAAKRALQSLVALERQALEERARRLEVLEAAVNSIDVRKDIDDYIQADKGMPGGRSRTGDDDDGGIAAALAVLNSHCEGDRSGNNGADGPRKYRNIERPSYFEGWAESGGGSSDATEDEDDEVEPEIFGDVIKLLFETDPVASELDQKEDLQAPDSPHRGKRDKSTSDSNHHDLLSKEEKIEIATKALAEKSTQQGQSFRKSVLYELNNQRSKKTQVESKENFDVLCHMFNAFLSGCGREAVDVSNAKMLMILSQTFYFVDQNSEGGDKDAAADAGNSDNDRSIVGSSTTKDRKSRIYVKSQICHHVIWSDDDFWDHALEQCVSESLAKSGVLLNYIRSNSMTLADGSSGGNRKRTVKWHDLNPDEYGGAAAQVHSVVFAQLGTLSRELLRICFF